MISLAKGTAMVHQDGFPYRIQFNYISPTTGEVLPCVQGVIHPHAANVAPRSMDGVILGNVHIGRNAWSFYSTELVVALAKRRRQYRPLRRTMHVDALIRLVPKADEPYWPGDMMPEVVAIKVKGLEDMFFNEYCPAAKSLVLV